MSALRTVVELFTICFALIAMQAQVDAQSLPSTRLDVIADGAYTYLETFGEISSNGVPNPGYFVSAEDIDDVLAYEDVGDSVFDIDIGHSEGTVSAEASVNTATNASDFAPTVDTSVQTLSDVSIVGGTDAQIAFCEEEVYCWAKGTFQIAENGSHPGVGTGADSATLTAQLWLVLSGPLNSGGGTYVPNTQDFFNDAVLYAQASDSWVAAYPLNLQMSVWAIEGSLQQSSSSDPTATPVTIDDSFGTGFNEMYIATQATNVSDNHNLVGGVYLDTGIRADNNSQTSFGPSGLDQRSWKASAWYQVQVP